MLPVIPTLNSEEPYFGVKWEIVWDAVKNEMPEIRLKIEVMLQEFDLKD